MRYKTNVLTLKFKQTQIDMKRIIKRTLNNSGEKSKTYIYDYENSVIFHKFTIIPKKDYEYMIGGESIVRETDRYMITFHRFAVKKTTLLEALSELNLLSI